jgi:hypothetical protein
MMMINSEHVVTDGIGTQRHFTNGVLHRDNGPAVECSNGDKYWYLNGKLHRVDGPAYLEADGTCGFYDHGQLITCGHMIEGVFNQVN